MAASAATAAAATLTMVAGVTELLWPAEGGKDAWPVYRGEQAHLDFGQGAAWDLADKEGTPLVAIAEGDIVQAAADPQRDDGNFHAGNLVILQCTMNGRTFRVHYCHMQALEVIANQHLLAGEIIGHVGHTGTVIDSKGEIGTVQGAHLHLWAQERVGNAWRRIWPSAMYG